MLLQLKWQNYLLAMKSKLFWVISLAAAIILSNSQFSQAQVSLADGGGSGYMAVNSYNGVEFKNIYILQIDVKAANVNVPNWSIMVRVNDPIRNSEGKVMDPSKISIRLNNVSGNAPTIQEIGANTNPIPLSMAEVPIIQYSRAPIQTGAFEYSKQMKFSFDIIIAAGSYLEALKSWQNYSMNLIFILRNAQDQVISQTNRVFGMQIQPTGTPPLDPTTPTLGIQVNSNARNGLLEFKTISDYVNGVSQTYQNGLSITANTPYAVQVKAASSNFIANDNTLPINTVSLSIKDPTNSAVGGTIALLENVQTVFNAINMGTQARLFDIRYFTQPNDERMLKSKPGNYQTTLTYTLIPQ